MENQKNKKIIQFYVRENYGVRREYVKNPADARILMGLTKQKTIDGQVRELIRDLTNGMVGFEQIIG